MWHNPRASNKITSTQPYNLSQLLPQAFTTPRVCGEMDITSVYGTKGLGFDFSHKKETKINHAPLAQLDRASVYGTEGRAFESPMAHH